MTVGSAEAEPTGIKLSFGLGAYDGAIVVPPSTTMV